MKIKLKYNKPEIGFSELPNEMSNKIDFKFTSEPLEVIPDIFTSGEIKDRTEKEATKMMLQLDGDKWTQDRLLDDLSILLDTDKGLVLLCGCCHAGILNTLKQIPKNLTDKKVTAIIGGTHMMIFSKKDLNHISEILKNEYDTPELYLNHCSGENTIKFFKENYASGMVHDIHVGDSLSFITK